MEAQNIKRNLNRFVIYKGIANIYQLTGGIIRKDKYGNEFYQAELTDTKHGKSIVICRLEDVTEISDV